MRKLMIVAAFALPMFGGAAMAQETLKIGYIDPLSGGGASVGEVGLKTFQFLADEVNAKGGIQGKKVEIVPLDTTRARRGSLRWRVATAITSASSALSEPESATGC